MKNKRIWLIIKAIVILLLIILIFVSPTDNNPRKWFRFIMLVLFVASFIIDLNSYKRTND